MPTTTHDTDAHTANLQALQASIEAAGPAVIANSIQALPREKAPCMFCTSGRHETVLPQTLPIHPIYAGPICLLVLGVIVAAVAYRLR